MNLFTMQRCLSKFAVHQRKAVPLFVKRKLVSATNPILEKFVVNVPSMGDSITEGTIVEWKAQVGQAVKADDVVALVETDKVTIDIKAEREGVITKHFGDFDETVEVGKALYEIDTEAEASANAVSQAAPEATTSTPETQKEEAPHQESTEKTSMDDTKSAEGDHHTPSIHFLGKEGWARVKVGQKEEATPTQEAAPTQSAPPSPTQKSSDPKAVTQADGSIIHPMYGRPVFSEAEMEALILGGASVAPMVLKYSKGSKFK